MDNILNILAYVGLAVLIVFLIIFEIREMRIGKNPAPGSRGYEYYTEGGEMLRIRHVFGSLFKVYVFGTCPITTRRDRLGLYFSLRKRSISEVEHSIDRIYQRR